MHVEQYERTLPEPVARWRSRCYPLQILPPCEARAKVIICFIENGLQDQVVLCKDVASVGENIYLRAS